MNAVDVTCHTYKCACVIEGGPPGLDPDCVTLSQAHAQLQADLATARATNTRLNRRCTDAEGALAEKIAAYPHRSFGRSLANAAATIYLERAQRAERRAACLRQALIEAKTALQVALIPALHTPTSSQQAIEKIDGVLEVQG